MAAVPGGKSGLLVHNVKSIGSGEFAERVDLYEVDTGLLQQCLALEKQAAQEVGDWEETKAQPATPAAQVQVNVITPERLEKMTIEEKQAEWRARMNSD
jgi:hypothetical protein